MTKIYINGKCFAQSLTGVQRFGEELIQALDCRFCSLTNDGITAELLVPDVPQLRIPHLKHIRVVRLPARQLHLWEQFVLPWHTRGHLLLNLAGSAPLLKRNQVCTFHDAAIFDFPQAYSRAFILWYRFLFRTQAVIATGLLTVSQFSRQRLSHHLKVSPHRLGIVSNGADHMIDVGMDATVMERLGLSPKSYLLAVGSTHPAKNFARLLEAFEQSEKRGVQLVVVGGANHGVFASDTKAIAPRSGVVRAGRVSDEELRALYRNAKAFLFPSLYEGFGIPPLEAMAAGCPVIAANAASIPEVCGDAVGYFDPLNTDDIQRCVQRAIDDEEWLNSLRIAGGRRVGQFTWSRSAGQLIAELKRIGVVKS